MGERKGFAIDPRAQVYYDRLTTEHAVEYAREHIEEWSYEDDPHGYCHTRPMLVKLVEAVERHG
jgi:hypothetical protein